MRRAKTDAAQKRLSDLLAYGRNTGSQNAIGTCRRDTLLDLLNYEGERIKPETGCCDVCEGAYRPGILEEAPLTAFFKRNPRSFTRHEAAALLSADGSTGWSEEEARTAIREMLHARKLRESANILWKGKLVPVPHIRVKGKK
jgi:hypothetical protein